MSGHLICLTFDFDAMSGFVARGLTSPTPISRGEFGNVGAVRILDLLDKHKVSASFFVPGTIINTYTDTCHRIAAEGHELGHHGWTHRPPTDLSRDAEILELVRGNDAINSITGKPARGYRSPSWDLSPHTIELLLEHGFDYDSSMMGHDYLPYYARTGDIVSNEEPVKFGETTSLVELPVSWSLDDHPHFEFYKTGETLMPGLRNASAVLENWLDDFYYFKDHFDWGVFTVTCHPYMIGRGHRMQMLERLIVELKSHDTSFVTTSEAVDIFKLRNSGQSL